MPEKLDSGPGRAIRKGAFPSGYRDLGADNLLGLSVPFCRAVGWAGIGDSVEVLIDLDISGHAKISLASKSIERLDADFQRYSVEPIDSKRLKILQVLDERYDVVAIKTNDPRIRLTESMLMHFGIQRPKGDGPWQATFFIQTGIDTIEVMTPNYRNTRLELYAGETSID